MGYHNAAGATTIYYTILQQLYVEMALRFQCSDIKIYALWSLSVYIIGY